MAVHSGPLKGNGETVKAVGSDFHSEVGGRFEVRGWVRAVHAGERSSGWGVYYRRPVSRIKGGLPVPRMAGTLLHLGDFDTPGEASDAAFDLAEWAALAGRIREERERARRLAPADGLADLRRAVLAGAAHDGDCNGRIGMPCSCGAAAGWLL